MSRVDYYNITIFYKKKFLVIPTRCVGSRESREINENCERSNQKCRTTKSAEKKIHQIKYRHFTFYF